MIVRIIRKLLASWPFWLGLFAGVFFITLNITGRNFQYFPGDLGDARFNMYILEHAHKFLTGKVESLWNAPFMYPESNVITYSENFVGTTPFYSAFRMMGIDRITSFQWWFLLITILNFTACYFFLKAVFKNRYAAVLGAFVFAFSISLQSQMTHAQTFTRFPIPLAFWMIFLFAKEIDPKYYFMALLFLVYQLYCSLYTGLLLLIPFTLLFAFSLLFINKVFYRKIKDFRWLIMIFGATLANVLISLPLIIPYIKRANQFSGFMHYEQIFHTIPSIRSFFFSQPGSLIWDFLSNHTREYTAWWDHQIFVGGIAMICMIISAVILILKIRKRTIFKQFLPGNFLIVISLVCLITYSCFTRIGVFSFYSLIFEIPGFEALRSLTRMINVELIFFAVAVGFVSNRLLKNHRWYTIPLFILMLGILLSDNYIKEGRSYRTEKSLVQARTKQLMEKMKGIALGSIVSYEPLKKEDIPIFYHLDAMIASQELNFKTVNGYSATSPEEFTLFWAELSPEGRMEWLKKNNISPDTICILH